MQVQLQPPHSEACELIRNAEYLCCNYLPHHVSWLICICRVVHTPNNGQRGKMTRGRVSNDAQQWRRKRAVRSTAARHDVQLAVWAKTSLITPETTRPSSKRKNFDMPLLHNINSITSSSVTSKFACVEVSLSWEKLLCVAVSVSLSSGMSYLIQDMQYLCDTGGRSGGETQQLKAIIGQR